MKFDHVTIWSGGLFLLLSLVWFIFLFLLQKFSFTFSVVASGGILLGGLITMIYYTVKHK